MVMNGRGRKWAPPILVVGACLVALSLAILKDGSADGSDPEKPCISNQRQRIASGDGPTGSVWRIIATVQGNNGCQGWLLGVEFYPSGSNPGSWRGAWAIPSGGHLSSRFTIGARDDAQTTGQIGRASCRERV